MCHTVQNWFIFKKNEFSSETWIEFGKMGHIMKNSHVKTGHTVKMGHYWTDMSHCEIWNIFQKMGRTVKNG